MLSRDQRGFILFFAIYCAVRVTLPFLFWEVSAFWGANEALRHQILQDNELLFQVLALLGAFWVADMMRGKGLANRSYIKELLKRWNRDQFFLYLPSILWGVKRSFWGLMILLTLLSFIGVAEVEAPRFSTLPVLLLNVHGWVQVFLFLLWLLAIERVRSFILREIKELQGGSLFKRFVFMAFELHLVLSFLSSLSLTTSKDFQLILSFLWVGVSYIAVDWEEHYRDPHVYVRRISLSLGLWFFAFYFLGFDFFGWRAPSFFQVYFPTHQQEHHLLLVFLGAYCGNFLFQSYLKHLIVDNASGRKTSFSRLR